LASSQLGYNSIDMNFLLVAQIIVAIAIVVLVLLQSSSSTLGSSFGVIKSGYHTKQGPEKMAYIATIISGVIFLILSLVNIALGS